MHGFASDLVDGAKYMIKHVCKPEPSDSDQEPALPTGIRTAVINSMSIEHITSINSARTVDQSNRKSQNMLIKLVLASWIPKIQRASDANHGPVVMTLSQAKHKPGESKFNVLKARVA